MNLRPEGARRGRPACLIWWDAVEEDPRQAGVRTRNQKVGRPISFEQKY